MLGFAEATYRDTPQSLDYSMEGEVSHILCGKPPKRTLHVEKAYVKPVAMSATRTHVLHNAAFFFRRPIRLLANQKISDSFSKSFLISSRKRLMHSPPPPKIHANPPHIQKFRFEVGGGVL